MIRWILAAAVLAPLFQEEKPEIALFARCDTQIPWLSDGVAMPDCESLGKRRTAPTRDPAEILEEAKKKAAAEKKLILWYVPRQPGSHMNRATILDSYIKVAWFTDPDVVEFINRTFIPVRCVVTKAMGTSYDLQRFSFVEPGLLFLTPEGERVHLVDRLRTFNAPWLLHVMRSVVAKKPEFAPTGQPVITNDLDRAIQARNAMDGPAALTFLEKSDGPEAWAEKGRVLLHMGKFSDARPLLEKSAAAASKRQAESLYWLALIDRSKAGWQKLAKDFPDSPWGWKAASHLVVQADTLPMGPGLHHFEDVVWPPKEALATLPTSTRWARTGGDAGDIARRAVDWLLLHQDPAGGWTDSRYVYCDTPKILPNVFVAVTSLACAALREWREVDPARIDDAVARGEKYLLDEKNMSRRNNEECYADAYRLLYLARRQATLAAKDRPAGIELMNRIVAALAKTQGRNGFWAHEYPNPFCTAAVVQCLHAGRVAGATVEDTTIAKAVEALKTTRSVDGRHAYAQGRPPSAAKDSSARNPVCESALFLSGAATADEVVHGLEGYFENFDRQNAVRVCDFHSDGELGGFFFFHGFFHAVEAARIIGDKAGGPWLGKLREKLVTLPEFDGSFLDSHELGKSYGTAMGLLSLKTAKAFKKEY